MKRVGVFILIYLLAVLNFLAIGSIIPFVSNADWLSPVGIIGLFLVPSIVAILVSSSDKVTKRQE